MKNTAYIIPAIFLLPVLFMFSCNRGTDRTSETGDEYLKIATEDYHKLLLTKGEVVYVPVYSEIFGTDIDKKIKLSATLSIRNTDMTNSIYVGVVDYYDTQGKLIRHYLDEPIKLGPLETASYLVEYKEAQGGTGANFIVEWVADQEVTEPVIEAVMIGTSMSLGISFVCDGRVIKFLNR